MSKRTYNIFFHLHTVSGIVITVGLFVIFFAGAFSLFLKEIEAWEHSPELNTSAAVPTTTVKSIDLDRLVHELEIKGYDLYGRNVYMDLQMPGPLQPVYLSGSQDTLATVDAREYKSLKLNPETYAITEISSKASATLGSLLYELHFFEQLGDFGYYLAGLISLFFLFAMVSGVIVHWKKIVSNFYLFRPYQKLKTVWTDAHTALGIIGIPFQFMYALTGAWFGLSILVATSGSILYNGDQSKYNDEVFERHDVTLGSRIKLNDYKLNTFIDSASKKWEGFQIKYISFHQTASSNMRISIYGEIDSKHSFFNFGELEFDVPTGRVVHFHDPYHKSYDEVVSAAIHRLHFGYFGLDGWRNAAVKALYFLLSVATCFVIVTGVLIWLEARKKDNVPEKRRKFNKTVGNIYLAICLSMLPVTAFSFLISKILPASLDEHRGTIINIVFFGGWLLLSVFFWLKKNNYFTNKYTLLSAGILGLLIPVANGAISANWLWYTFVTHQHAVFIVDVLWLALSTSSLVAVYFMNKQRIQGLK